MGLDGSWCTPGSSAPHGLFIRVGEPQKRAGTAMIYSGTATRKRVAVPAHFVAVPEYRLFQRILWLFQSMAVQLRYLRLFQSIL